MKITKSQLVEKIRATKGAQFVTFETVTEAQASKAKSAKVVKKLSYVSLIINFVYANSVNNQLSREGKTADFTPKARTWGVKVHPSLVEHKGKFYVCGKVEKSLVAPRYFVNGKEVEKSEVEHLLRKSSKPATQADLDKEVVERDYKVESIHAVTMGGTRYEVVDV